MFSNDSNGINTRALEMFSKKFFMGLADSERTFRQMVKKSFSFNMGMSNGATFSHNVVGDLDVDGAPIAENAETPLSNPDIQKISVTVLEYGRKIDYSKLLKMTAELSIEDIFRKVLARHAAQTLDKACHDLVFATTELVCWPTSATQVLFDTTGVVATPNTSTNLTLDHILSMVTYFKQNRVEGIDGKYYFIGSPALLQPIKKELSQVNQYTETAHSKTVKGIISEYYGVIFVEQTNVNTKDGYMVGKDCGVEVLVEPENIIVGETRDLGRSREIGWHAIVAFNKIKDGQIIRFDGRSA